MAFTEATLTALLDPTGGGRTIALKSFITTNAASTSIYA